MFHYADRLLQAVTYRLLPVCAQDGHIGVVRMTGCRTGIPSKRQPDHLVAVIEAKAERHEMMLTARKNKTVELPIMGCNLL